ncbi:short-chain dehydrogenase reductase family 42E member 2 [Pelobates cultripes]|uniref:Short-chain dehydrogenase reductase family 42E member 2 n=1 Tax=Pelobates cultripes TaxID=61616 RepID=A0AAD1WDX6_PELCU|nr:short-chain dehydrogenase reductase family 42E member 2 [Pelobates cultripes]
MLSNTREGKVSNEMEGLMDKVKMQDICLECLKSALPFRPVTKHRSNGVVPHQSWVLPCNPKNHLPTNHCGVTKALITGGAGYLGHNLGCTLIKLGVSVVLFDVHEPEWEIPTGAVFMKRTSASDIRDYDSLYKACEGVDCVFHVASIGMSGIHQRAKQWIESINIGGTKVVIDVCIQRSIPSLIYTSSVNVAFSGNCIVDGDEETVPYIPLDKIFHEAISAYGGVTGASNRLYNSAHRIMLSVESRDKKPGMLGACYGNKLHTCVLRPPGIYGPDERRHLPRLAVNIERRLLCFKFGSNSTKMNWIHLCNLIEAHILAAKGLTSSKEFIASGKAYYIHDGENVNLFDWLHPLFEKLGQNDPWIKIPSSLVYTAAYLSEYMQIALSPIFHLNPLLTTSEVKKIAVTHTFRIDKARKELGFNPKKFSFEDSVDYYVQSRRKSSQNKKKLSNFGLGSSGFLTDPRKYPSCCMIESNM